MKLDFSKIKKKILRMKRNEQNFGFGKLQLKRDGKVF